MYYKQTYKTSCLLDAASYICRIDPKVVIKDAIKRFDKNSICFKGGYMKFSPIINLLRHNNIDPVIKYIGNDVELYKEPVEMILGANLYDNDDCKPLHALYYDGRQAWEGCSQKFVGELKDLKIVYSVICYRRDSAGRSYAWSKNTSKYLAETMAWEWDSKKRDKKDISKNFTGQWTYLKVI
jgi:hypothetical protein